MAASAKTFVLYPSLGVGHLIPMVELAKHLLRRGHSAVVAVVDPPDGDAASAAAVARLAAANPSIAFRLLAVPPSPDPAAHPVRRAHDTLRLANPALRAFLRALPAPADALLLDMFCGDASAGGEKRHECLAWLDAQPEKSVVFLCFGSKGAFSAAQLKEIARGLESSGHRFLWAVRSPPEEQREFPEPDLGRLLPAGFLERTRGRGMVVKNWVPQAEVVRHEAVGAFMTHCGWNSALEAIMSGLPMVCWPLYAEQAQNKVFMVEEMKIAVALEGYEKGTVKAEEIDAKLRLVMETEEGRKLREMLAAARKMASDAIGDGGSSEVAFAEFLRDLESSSMENEGCNN
ncbi:unnamed protein product [Triticum turgidum subsp. durum]|uniref:UDP-glycosyltransferases domain-containing protein n=1 Tax=Triticum turgidum subsp. durum TaxID=4567 RepID=A0A9R0R3A9_TRITD|nr:unnamed protein product [Triticum turgidum subsp. durum]